MGDIVNLRRARKQAKRQLDEERAVANRLRHGRGKVDKVRQAALDDKARVDLDGHRIETGDDG
jgi:hypothetical protein